MKIVEIIGQLSSGGAERFTVDLCNKLSEKNEVTLIVLLPLVNNDFYLHELSSRVNVISMNKGNGFQLKIMLQIRSLIKELAPDVVHTHLRSIVYLLLTVLTIPKISYFHTVHSDAIKEAGDQIGVALRKFLFKWRRVTPVAISEESKNSFENFYNISPEIIINGRDIPRTISISDYVRKEIESYRGGNNSKIIINLARIVEVKQQTILAKVASRLSKEGYNFTLLIIGNNSDKDRVNEILSYKCPQIHILGEKSNPLEYLAMADAYCLCSSYEGMPISLIEALGVGLVPICTPVGGIINIISNGKNGFLAAGTSEQDIYCMLKEYLETSDNALLNIRSRARDSYIPFTMKRCSENYIKLFSKL